MLNRCWGAGLRRVLAARDREAVQPLYWGVTPDERFMVRAHLFSDRVEILGHPPLTPHRARTPLWV